MLFYEKCWRLLTPHIKFGRLNSRKLMNVGYLDASSNISTLRKPLIMTKNSYQLMTGHTGGHESSYWIPLLSWLGQSLIKWLKSAKCWTFWIVWVPPLQILGLIDARKFQNDILNAVIKSNSKISRKMSLLEATLGEILS